MKLMVQLEVHHQHGLEVNGGYVTSTYSRFTIEVDSVDKHGEYYATCPVCARTLHLTIFPGLKLPQAITAQLTWPTKPSGLVRLILFVLSPLLLPLLLIVDYLLNLECPVIRCLALIYLLACIAVAWDFVSDVRESTKLKCFVRDQIQPYHYVWHKGRSITATDLEELNLRTPYYR